MSRRIVASSTLAEPEIRQRGMVYQKGRKQSDAWSPAERAYGYFRVDIPGEVKQKEVRVALGFCRDKMSAMLKLHGQMEEAGVLDAAKIRERISPVTTFRSQSIWMLAEMKAGRIVNRKTRKPIRSRTISGYSTAIAYLCGVVGDRALASLDNSEARELVAKMKAERKENGKARFSEKTICEYYKSFTQVIASAEENGNPLFPRKWNLAYICLPMVKQRDQHRPTVEREEVEALVSKVKRPVYAMVAALLCGTGIRISELLALEIGKHISADCKVITISQQRGEKDTLEPPKTENGYRTIDLCEPLANALKTFIGKRKNGFLLQTDNGKMLSRQNLWRDGFATIAREMGLNIGFHAFRRFRESVLQASECRDLLINFWMGHGDAEMSSRYAKQLVANRKFRQEWSAKVGLGFEVPKLELFAIRAIRNQESAVAA